MDNIIAIFGSTCTLKTEVAQELSLMTGFKLSNRGEKATTQAKYLGKATTAELPVEFHRSLDDETRLMATWDEKLMIFESAFMDAVLKDAPNVFLVHLHANEKSRQQRWHVRKEEGGGRTRQLGASFAERDQDDQALRSQLYGNTSATIAPAMTIDTSDRPANDIGRQIWDSFQAEAHLEVLTNKPPMDKAAARGIFPGPTQGVVTRFHAQTTPFGGYIRDSRSGQEIYVHKSAVSDIENGNLSAGMKVDFEIVADSFGGFKAIKLSAA